MADQPPFPWDTTAAIEVPSKDMPCGCGPEAGFCERHRQPLPTALLRALRKLGR